MTSQRLCRAVLIAISVAFVLSAWLYGIATIRTARVVQSSQVGGTTSAVVEFFRDYGAVVLLVELVLLAVAVVAMIRSDRRNF